jgi:hypothetical protein
MDCKIPGVHGTPPPRFADQQSCAPHPKKDAVACVLDGSFIFPASHGRRYRDTWINGRALITLKRMLSPAPAGDSILFSESHLLLCSSSGIIEKILNP